MLGYLSDCYTLCSQQGLDFYEFWNSCKQYYVHGKDNIPFHTIILPSLLLGRTDVKLKLPDEIISSEYLTLEGRKISTSGNWAIKIEKAIWQYVVASSGLELGPVEILFERIDKKVIEEEEIRLKGQ